MKLTKAREKLFRNDRPSFGMNIQLCDVECTEMAGSMGYDFVFIDGEHNYLTMETAAKHFLAAAAYDMVSLYRVVDFTRAEIQRALDAGADGIIAPCVRTKADAEKIVDLACYPPLGHRGMCPSIHATNRAIIPFGQYLDWANEQSLVFLLIETKDAVENIEEIASIEGIDGFFLGPYDLSTDMGIPMQIDHPDVVAALDHVIEVAKKHGKEIMYPTSTQPGDQLAAICKDLFRKGVKVIPVGGDIAGILTYFGSAMGMIKKNF